MERRLEPLRSRQISSICLGVFDDEPDLPDLKMLRQAAPRQTAELALSTGRLAEKRGGAVWRPERGARDGPDHLYRRGWRRQDRRG